MFLRPEPRYGIMRLRKQHGKDANERSARQYQAQYAQLPMTEGCQRTRLGDAKPLNGQGLRTTGKQKEHYYYGIIGMDTIKEST